jgi:hypothetical protein
MPIRTVNIHGRHLDWFCLFVGGSGGDKGVTDSVDGMIESS